MRRPSAIVRGSFEGWIEPVASERRASSALAGSAPMTRVEGEWPLTARAVPEISPPPPIGAITMSSGPACSSSSSAAVPWPAMTDQSLNG